MAETHLSSSTALFDRKTAHSGGDPGRGIAEEIVEKPGGAADCQQVALRAPRTS